MSASTRSSDSPVEILIAEDSPTQAQRLQHILQQQGYHVTVTTNGRQALEAARQRKPTLIISDVIMPEMDGYELCHRVKSDARLGNVPLILVTTLSDPQDVIRGLECRADNFILKPYDEHYLLSRVQFVLINHEMRHDERVGMGVQIFFNNQKHFITADRMQILNLLLSTYEAAIQRNKELQHSQGELQLLNTKLEAANHELEAFSYSVSHDLRAPLRHIDGFAEMLREECAPVLNGSGQRYLGIITESVKQMGQLIDDLLLFSKMGRVEMHQTQVDMGELVTEVVKALAEESRHRSIEWDIEPLPDVRGDRSMLRQVWVNLLSNSVKYTRLRPLAKIGIGYSKTDGEFYVQDNGAGFEMTHAARLFGVFQRLHRAEEFEGTGVGLANVQRIITRHGGRIRGQGKVDEGATFYFTLPIHLEGHP